MPSLNALAELHKMVAAESLHVLCAERDMDVLASATSLFGEVEAKPKVSHCGYMWPFLSSSEWHAS